MRRFLWRLAKWFLFRIDAESAHLLTLALIRLGIRLGGIPLRISSGARPLRAPAAECPQAFGLAFGSRVGLAAGFDKNAEILEGLPSLGFGFAEIGTVTPRPQPGNDRPRLFRDPARSALFNRMGFNGLGATVIAERLARARPRLPATFRVGVNIGKNKDIPNDRAPEDYARAIAPFAGLGDYVVINVSSPNTPGLRDLQESSALRRIVDAVASVMNGAGWSKRPPLLLKLAPEIAGEALTRLLGELESWGNIDGWVLTNTLAGEYAGGSGGWSGEPLRLLARARLAEAARATKLPIVSVGGIMSGEEAEARLAAGASLVQIYSGWIFGGPSFPAEIGRKTQKKKP